MLETFHLRHLKRSLLVVSPPEEVFDYFSRVQNLGQVIPPWLQCRILSPDTRELQKGSQIHYSLKLNGIPFQWVSEVTNWDPPHTFSDKQIKGPLHHWEHQHNFSSSGRGTIIEDSICFAVPGFFLETIVYHLFVKNQLNRIFDFREQRFREIFGWEESE